MGEFKDILIHIASNPKVHHFIDIIVVDIPEACVLLLCRDWSQKLQSYFAFDWSHFWLPWYGQSNMSIIGREKYMKLTVTNLEATNEPSSLEFSILENYSIASHFENFIAETSTIPHDQQFEIFQGDLSHESWCNIVSVNTIDSTELEKMKTFGLDDVIAPNPKKELE